MARFTVTRDVAAGATDVWNALVDWPRHGDWVPLTTVRVRTDRPGGVGAEFVAFTGLGPLGFDDHMRVVVWEPPVAGGPGTCEVVKLGRVLRGRARFTVTPLAGRRCRVVWFEDVTLTPHAITRFGGPVLSLVGRLGFTSMLKALERDVATPVG